MGDLVVLDVALGLALAYLTVALAVSAISEAIASKLNWRGKDLMRGIELLVAGQAVSVRKVGFLSRFINLFSRIHTVSAEVGLDPAERDILNALKVHPKVIGLGQSKDRLPSYVPSRNFANALLEIVSVIGVKERASADVEDWVARLPVGPLRKSLISIIDEANGDIERFRAGVGQMFDDAMDRVTGWYRRRAQLVNFLLAFLVAASLNIDTFRISERLFGDTDLRLRLAVAATKLEKETDVKIQKDALASAGAQLEKLGLPVGWDLPSWDGTKDFSGAVTTWLKTFYDRNFNRPNRPLFIAILGLIMTAIAGSLGAPFWFDAIGKIVALRGSGEPPPKFPKTEPQQTAPTVPIVPPAPGPNAALSSFEAQLTQGDTERLQRALRMTGANVTRIIDDPTRAMVRVVQKEMGFPANGIVSQRFFRALLASR